jgi:hypothetical protein
MLFKSWVNAMVTKINSNKMIYGFFNQLMEVKLFNVGCEFEKFSIVLHKKREERFCFLFQES